MVMPFFFPVCVVALLQLSQNDHVNLVAASQRKPGLQGKQKGLPVRHTDHPRHYLWTNPIF